MEIYDEDDERIAIEQLSKERCVMTWFLCPFMCSAWGWKLQDPTKFVLSFGFDGMRNALMETLALIFLTFQQFDL